MEFLLIGIAVFLSLIGIVGCIIPGIPGPPFNFVALLLVQWAISPFEVDFILIAGAAAIAVTVLDFILPVWVAKKFGATRAGMIGSIVGLLAGLVFAPVGIIFGLVAGAIIGDLIAGKNLGEAVYSGVGSALGTLFSTGFKLIVSGMLTYYMVKEVFCYFVSCGNISPSS